MPALPVYQSTLAEAAFKVTSRKGWAAERVERFVALTDLAVAALCTYDAGSVELVIDQVGDGLQATVSGNGGDGAATSASVTAFEKAAASKADDCSVSSPPRALRFRID